MARLVGWYKERIDELENTIEYKIESVAFDISVQIYKQMKKLGINKKELAEKLNVSKSYITQLLKGKSNMTIETLIKVAEALGMTLQIKLVEKTVNTEVDIRNDKNSALRKSKYLV